MVGYVLVRWRIGMLVIWAGALVCMRPWELPRVVVGLRVGSRANQGGAWSSGLGLEHWFVVCAALSLRCREARRPAG